MDRNKQRVPQSNNGFGDKEVYFFYLPSYFADVL